MAPGQAVITASYGELTDACIVRCRWEAAPDSVDLAAFAQTVLDDYDLASRLELIDPDDEFGRQVLDNFYSGLTGLTLPQCLVYFNNFSMNSCELVFLEAADADDAAAAAAILQARVNYMVDGGAWYPEPTRIWSECSRVVTNGNYVIMVVHEQCEDIVQAFNDLF